MPAYWMARVAVTGKQAYDCHSARNSDPHESSNVKGLACRSALNPCV